jgi:hypothetical protein
MNKSTFFCGLTSLQPGRSAPFSSVDTAISRIERAAFECLAELLVSEVKQRLLQFVAVLLASLGKPCSQAFHDLRFRRGHMRCLDHTNMCEEVPAALGLAISKFGMSFDQSSPGIPIRSIDGGCMPVVMLSPLTNLSQKRATIRWPN